LLVDNVLELLKFGVFIILRELFFIMLLLDFSHQVSVESPHEGSIFFFELPDGAPVKKIV